TTDARLSQSVRVLVGVEDFIMLLLQQIYSRISLNGCITPPPCSVEYHVCPDQRFQQMRSRPRGPPEPLLVKCPYAQAKKEIRNKLQQSLIRANAPVNPGGFESSALLNRSLKWTTTPAPPRAVIERNPDAVRSALENQKLDQFG